MLNKIWPIFIIFSILYAFIFGNINNVNSEIFNSTESAINVTISLLGTMCLWSGIMKIASNISLIDKLCKLFNPIINYLFPEYKENKKIKKQISMNIIANFLGLGNAATPLGLKAAQSMKNKKNNEKLTNSMMTLILLNTTSIQLIPTTIFAIRQSLGSRNPTSILLAVWCSTACAAIGGIIILKIMIKKGK